MRDRGHLFLWPVLVIGIVLVVLPFALSMPSKTATAQRLMNDFHPVIQAATVAAAAHTAYDGLASTELAARAKQELAVRAPGVAAALTDAYGLGKTAAQQILGPETDKLQTDMAGLGNLSGLSQLRFLTWMLVIPGGLLILLAGSGLAMGGFKRRARVTA